MDRAQVYGTWCWEFESLALHHKFISTIYKTSQEVKARGYPLTVGASPASYTKEADSLSLLGCSVVISTMEKVTI